MKLLDWIFLRWEFMDMLIKKNKKNYL
jgi:hypothetical protein